MDMLSLIYRRIEGFFKSIISRLAVKLSKIKRLPITIAKKSKDILKDVVTFITKKPSEIGDYVRLGKSYVAKRALLAILLLISGIVLAIIWFVVPFVSKTFFASKLTVNTAEFYNADGQAEVYTANGKLLYTGQMSKGMITGNGTLYDNEKLIYQGAFADNEYEGTGKLYDYEGNLIYSGEFSKSLYNGSGMLYYSNGQLKVNGTFVSGKLDGNAEMYDEDGNLLYNGGFSAGNYSGNGELYQNGKLKYKGEFVAGEMTGQGTLFDSKGSKIYTGGFVSGVYSGQGELNDFSNNLRILGSFSDGLAEGQAEIYNINGEMIFSGLMSKGEISYYNYISSDKTTVEQSFTAKTTLREIDNFSLEYFSELGVGFVFDSNDKVDRIIITGKQVIFGAENGKSVDKYTAPENSSKYNTYSFTPTDSEKKILNYIGITAPSTINCTKYITDSVFIKLYYVNETISYYEIGTV